MRTFKIVQANPGEAAHHLWSVVAVAENGQVMPLETYETYADAEAAKLVLERQEVDDPS